MKRTSEVKESMDSTGPVKFETEENPCDEEPKRKKIRLSRMEKKPKLEALFRQDNDIIAVNKPFDVRIDGDFPITVKNLVEEQFPEMMQKSKKEETSRQQQPERKLRFPHQLDYATSGVLCLAFTRQSCSQISQCFQSRTAKKMYLALVRNWFQIDEDTEYEDFKNKNRPPTPIVINDDDDIPKTKWPTTTTTTQTSSNIKNPAEDVKKEDLVKKSNTLQLPSQAQATKTEVKEEFRTDDKINRANTYLLQESKHKKVQNERIHFTIESLIGKDSADANDFKMYNVPMLYKLGMNHIEVNTEDFKSKETQGRLLKHVSRLKELKKSKTEGWVISNGYYVDPQKQLKIPVSKVLLKLHTGRRHQLRLHLRSIGHPILGDATYYNDRDTWRMFLHSWILKMPFGSEKALKKLQQEEKTTKTPIKKEEKLEKSEKSDKPAAKTAAPAITTTTTPTTTTTTTTTTAATPPVSNTPTSKPQKQQTATATSNSSSKCSYITIKTEDPFPHTAHVVLPVKTENSGASSSNITTSVDQEDDIPTCLYQPTDIFVPDVDNLIEENSLI